jgi:hypothetical protein
MAQLRAITLVICLLACICGSHADAQTTGTFTGELILKVLPGGRNMQLVQPFSYMDSRGNVWPVPAGARVDGASIPSVFWSAIGAPFTGKFREASVIHDYYCETRSRHWKAVHRVFLDGMQTSGVDPLQAKLMYLAVYRFGPRWDFDINACFCAACPPCAKPVWRHYKSYRSMYKQSDFDDLKKRLTSGNYSLDELESFADYQLASELLK